MALCLRVELQGKPCVVFGGGAEGFRRTLQLIEEGANVTVYSREFSSKWEPYASLCHKEAFCPSQLQGAFFAAAATNDPEVNEQIVYHCVKNGILVVSSTPSQSPFHPMANRPWTGGVVAVSIPQAPALSGMVSQDLAQQAENQYTQAVSQMAKLRSLAYQQLSSQQAAALLRKAVAMSCTKRQQLIETMEQERKLP